MVTSAALLPLEALGTVLEIGTLCERKDLLRGNLNEVLNMHPSVGAQTSLFHGNISYGQHVADQCTPVPTLAKALSHAKRLDGIYRQLESSLSF